MCLDPQNLQNRPCLLPAFFIGSCAMCLLTFCSTSCLNFLIQLTNFPLFSFKCYCRQTIKNNECDESPLCVYNLHALCSASFWIAIKFAAPRECLPGTSFMAMVVSKLLRSLIIYLNNNIVNINEDLLRIDL